MLKLLGAHWYSTKFEPKIRVKLRGLTGLEYMEFQDLVVQEHDQETLEALDPFANPQRSDPPDKRPRLKRKVCEFILQRAVVDWEGVNDAEGNPAPVTAETVGALGYLHIGELVNEVLLYSQLSEEQVKNLSSQSRLQPTPGPSTAETANGAGTATPATPRPSQSSSSPESPKAISASSPCRPEQAIK